MTTSYWPAAMPVRSIVPLMVRGIVVVDPSTGSRMSQSAVSLITQIKLPVPALMMLKVTVSALLTSSVSCDSDSSGSSATRMATTTWASPPSQRKVRLP